MDKNSTLKNKVSVVVVTYDSSSFIDACLTSLVYNNFCREIIVIDNASRDQEDCRKKAERFSTVRFIANQINIGYSAAVNQGAKLISGEYLFFMNPDVLIPEGTVEKLVTFMESHTDCGSCSPYVKTPEKSCGFDGYF